MKKRFQLISLFCNSQLLDVLRANWPLVLGICLIMIAETGLTLLLPWPIRSMVDHVINHPDLRMNLTQDGLFTFILKSIRDIFIHPNFYFIFEGIGLLLFIYISNSALIYFENVSLARLGQRAILRLRENLFSHLINLPQDFFEKTKTGDLTSRIAQDTADVQDILESIITVLIRSLPTVIGIIVVSFMMDRIYSLTFFDYYSHSFSG